MKRDLTRRRLLQSGVAAVAASRIVSARSMGPPSRSFAPQATEVPEHAPFHRPPGVPPVKYIREKVFAAKVVEACGEYHDELIPDTCDVEERARLFLDNFLNSITVPELDNEPFNRDRYSRVPPRLTLDTGGYLCAMPKYRESLPLLRIMTGSRKGLDIDRDWAENLLQCIGPDGLSYVPRVGRPWDEIGAYDFIPKGSQVEFYAALPLGNGRLLGSLASYYQMTHDEVWNHTARGVVDRLNTLAVKVGDASFFSKFNLLLGEKISSDDVQSAIAGMKQFSEGETDRNTPMWQTWMTTGLAQYYRASGYEPARELASRLVRYMREVHYIDKWRSHTHLITLGIQAALETAQICHDQELAEYGRRAYDFAKSGEKVVALPDIGFFVNPGGASSPSPEGIVEGCTIADMTAIAVKLTQLEMGDQYWEDIDRYTRNCMTGTQMVHSDIPAVMFAKLAEQGAKPAPVKYYELADRLAKRLIGSFNCFSRPNDIFGNTTFSSCCNGNLSRALYYVWESIVKHEKQELKVNLLLNRTSPWADIRSFIPYDGRVDINVKKPLVGMKVRMNDWIDKRQVVCRVDGEKRAHRWERNYVVLGDVKPRQVVQIEFPIDERPKSLEAFGVRYRATFRGNDVVDISPKGEMYPLFQRDYYRSERPRYIRAKKFTCENPIHY